MAIKFSKLFNFSSFHQILPEISHFSGVLLILLSSAIKFLMTSQALLSSVKSENLWFISRWMDSSARTAKI